MITLTLQGVGWKVEPVVATDEAGNPISMQVIVFVDPQTGITVHVPLAQPAADEIAAALRSKPGIAVVPASAMPPKVRG